MHTLFINIGIYSTTLAWTVISLLFSPLALLAVKLVRGCSTAVAVRDLVWFYGRVWIKMTSLFVPIQTSNVRSPEPCILVLNHSSFFDTYLLAAQPIRDVCMTIRDWPYKIPCFRPFMEAAEYVRTEQAEGEQVVEQSVKELQAGHSMTFYPEGTRTHTGNLGRFRSGAFATAIKANVPVVPMCISGSYGFLPRGAKSFGYSPIKITILPPIYPDKYSTMENGHTAMRKDVKSLMAQTLEEMAGTE